MRMSREDRKQQIYRIIAECPEITVEELVDVSNLGECYVRSLLKEMLKEGAIYKHWVQYGSYNVNAYRIKE